MKKLLLLTLMTVISACSGEPSYYASQGEQGPPGTPASARVFVQLCPGTQSYPGVFIEYAECINDNLWGVYSANNGFYTFFPPGNYSSNALGSACNLTIQPHCVVTH